MRIPTVAQSARGVRGDRGRFGEKPFTIDAEPVMDAQSVMMDEAKREAEQAHALIALARELQQSSARKRAVVERLREAIGISERKRAAA